MTHFALKVLAVYDNRLTLCDFQSFRHFPFHKGYLTLEWGWGSRHFDGKYLH